MGVDNNNCQCANKPEMAKQNSTQAQTTLRDSATSSATIANATPIEIKAGKESMTRVGDKVFIGENTFRAHRDQLRALATTRASEGRSILNHERIADSMSVDRSNPQDVLKSAEGVLRPLPSGDERTSVLLADNRPAMERQGVQLLTTSPTFLTDFHVPIAGAKNVEGNRPQFLGQMKVDLIDGETTLAEAGLIEPALIQSEKGEKDKEKPPAEKEIKCQCSATMDTTFGPNGQGWQWQTDEKTENKDTSCNKAVVGDRRSHDIKGKDYPDKPPVIYWKAKVNITATKGNKPLSYKVTCIATGVVIKDYGKAGVQDDKIEDHNISDWLTKNADEIVEWAKTVLGKTEEEAKKWAKSLENAKFGGSSGVRFVVAEDTLPCKTATQEIVAKITPLPLSVEKLPDTDFKKYPNGKPTYNHTKYICELEVCDQSVLSTKNDNDDPDTKKINVCDSTRKAGGEK